MSDSADKKQPWHVSLLTLFPEMFPGTLGFSLAGKALEEGIWSYSAANIRDYAIDKHRSVDDIPYGGGAGMVMRADVLGRAIEAVHTPDRPLLYMSPRGKVLDTPLVEALVSGKGMTILCGRFEGIDERLIEEYQVQEVSIGDYVLSGGEPAAMVLMDACIRRLSGVVGNETTFFEESFGQNADYAGLLEYPLYTRPPEWKGRLVPEVLVSGHHKRINTWRLECAEALTEQKRPDLWEKYRKKT